MKKPLLFLFLLTTLTGFTQIPNGYYNNANGKTGDELKTALHNIIKGHHVVSYGGLINAFAYTDCKPNGKIWDIYSNYEYSLSTGLCGEYEQEGDCWNREHTWPQSWFNQSTTPRSDLFHVYPTDGFVNAQRGNYPFGEVNNLTYTSGNGSKLGPCVTLGYSGKVFEPVDEYKGDIARSYFYMSVRYTGEDDDWGTSGMTNKADIKPWAMTMLLRWSDEDPVSQKEIDRNNAVYGYQNNRNPFIDHPEYARMIWDENWQGGTYYNITCATGLQHGSVSAPESAMEGSTVAITATPAPGHMVDTYTVYKTGSPSTTVNVSSNGTFTMPGYAVTVSATFVENNTYYDITLGEVSHGTINASEPSAKSGTSIMLAANPESGYSLYAWYVFKTGDMGTTVNVSGNSFVMPAFDVTVMATFVQGSAGYHYVKVTTAPTYWSGEYLIVYENGSKAFNGGLTELDANDNTISVTINENGIASNATTDAARFTIAPMSGGYSIQSASGKYIGYSGSSNGLTASTTALQNTISLSNGSIIIQGTGTSTLQYNGSANRFRYYGSTQQPIQLYKKTSNTPTPTHGIHFNPNGGMGMMDDQTVTEFEPTALNANAFTRENYVFDGWNTEAVGTGDYYADEATVILLEDLELYAQWNQLFSITLAEVSHGTIGCSATQAFEGDEIILTAQPDPCYVLAQWTVTDAQGNLITVTEDQFDMPASDVTVSAVFAYSSQSFVQEYQLVTSAEQLVAGRTYLIVNYANGKALGTTQNNNNRSAAEVSIEGDIISTIDNTVCELTLGTAGGNWTFFDAGWGNNGGYLYAASNSSNYLKTQASNNANGQWSITIGEDGTATLAAQGSNLHNLLKYNNQNDIFSCYASGSTQLEVCLFRRTEISDYPAEQPVTLASGWTWWAPTVVSSTLLSQLEEALGMSGILINSQNNGFARYVNGSWESSLPGLVVGQMYRIQTSAPCQFTLSGVPATGVEVTIVPGYNWFGYTGAEPLRLADLDISPAPASGDKINSQEEGFAVFNGTMWSGTLTSLQPGKGYVYISVASLNKTMSFE